MSRWPRFCQTVHIVSLGLWLGTVLMAGAAAAVLFPTLKALDVRVPALASYEGQHWRLAGGRIGQQVFLVADVIQFGCALLAAVTLIVLFAARTISYRRASSLLRATALAVAIASVAGELLVLAPSMNAAFNSLWAAAQVGDGAAAAIHQKAFDELHPMATNLLSIDAVAVLVALVLAASAVSSGAAVRGNSSATGPSLEEPALLRMRR